MRAIARAASMLQALAGALRGHDHVAYHHLTENFSFVLHEHSRSATVQQAARESLGFHHGSEDRRTLPLVDDPATIPAADIWLSVSLGLQEELLRLAARHPAQPRVTFVDAANGHNDDSVSFFRAPALLHLPDDLAPAKVIVVSLPVRPGGLDAEIVHTGPFDWPADRDAILQSLETVVRRDVHQWIPPARLWSGPAEKLLPNGEIHDPA
ncbi:MAG: hypothetical protein ACOC9Y_04425 [Chloroflexota bacterium]